jgi:hypothetical protein
MKGNINFQYSETHLINVFKFSFSSEMSVFPFTEFLLTYNYCICFCGAV